MTAVWQSLTYKHMSGTIHEASASHAYTKFKEKKKQKNWDSNKHLVTTCINWDNDIGLLYRQKQSNKVKC